MGADIPIVYPEGGPVCFTVDQAGLVSRLSGTFRLFPVVSGPRAESVLIPGPLWSRPIMTLVQTNWYNAGRVPVA
jgi:hypothetical protein